MCEMRACCLTGKKNAALISPAQKPMHISSKPLKHSAFPARIKSTYRPSLDFLIQPSLQPSLPRTAFQVTTGNKTWFVKAADEDKDENVNNWVSAIRGAIARLKQETGSPEVSRVPEFTHHSIGGRDFVLESRYTELKYAFVFVWWERRGGRGLCICMAGAYALLCLCVDCCCARVFMPSVSATRIRKESPSHSPGPPSLPPSPPQTTRQRRLRHGRLGPRHANRQKNRHKKMRQPLRGPHRRPQNWERNPHHVPASPPQYYQGC